ncbi:terminase small subunit [Lactobacillus sp. Marseille-P7033]|nr:terminase small subunit [Lactobacillus sp. Marseille-P7033]
MKLTQKQRLFADEYIKSGNAMQSAIKAGYSEKYAKSSSAKMLENVGIKSYIDAKMAEIESHKIADSKEVLEFYTRVLRKEETEEVVVATKTDVITVEKKPDFKDRVAVAKELMKRYPLSDPIVQAQLKKLNADTRISEARAKNLEDNGADVEDLVSGLISAIGKEDKHESS